MPVSVDNCQNGDGVSLQAEKDCEWEAADLRPAYVATPEHVEVRVRTDARPTRLDLSEELTSEAASLKFIPEELGFQLELGAPTDA
jgi:hypothetical protein